MWLSKKLHIPRKKQERIFVWGLANIQPMLVVPDATRRSARKVVIWSRIPDEQHSPFGFPHDTLKSCVITKESRTSAKLTARKPSPIPLTHFGANLSKELQ